MNKPDGNLLWYNYKTGRFESRETPSDFTDYIPQSPPAQGMYSVLLEMGQAPIFAALEVLTACAKEAGVETRAETK